MSDFVTIKDCEWRENEDGGEQVCKRDELDLM